MITMSESTEMYLLRTALLQRESQPVPLSLLAQELDVSTVSANEMCRKLMHDGLLIYEPYKGVTLTEHGSAIALRVLRRRRLWEVFLVTHLHLPADEAERIACRFEHVTPDHVADRLGTMLGEPRYTTRSEPIPQAAATEIEPPALAATELGVGGEGEVVAITASPTVGGFLCSQGLRPGARIRVLAASGRGQIIVRVGGQELVLEQALAEHIRVVVDHHHLISEGV